MTSCTAMFHTWLQCVALGREPFRRWFWMICSILTIRPVNRVSCEFFSHCTHAHAKPSASSLQHGSAVRHSLLAAAPGSVGAKLTFLSAYGVMSFILHKLQRSGRKRYRTVKTTTECHGRDINAVRSNCASKAQFSKSHHPPNRPWRQSSKLVKYSSN